MKRARGDNTWGEAPWENSLMQGTIKIFTFIFSFGILLTQKPLWRNGRRAGFRNQCFLRVGSSPTKGKKTK